MITYSHSNFRPGLKIIIDNEPYTIEYSEFVKSGRSKAFVRLKLRRLLNGTIIERTFKSTTFFTKADVIDINLTYIYNDGKFWYFINKETFEELVIDIKIIGNSAKWLFKQTECTVTLWNDKPISVVLPNFVELEIVDTNHCLKGDTLGAGTKLATLSTGAVVKVPLFVKTGEYIKIDTRCNEYASRVR